MSFAKRCIFTASCPGNDGHTTVMFMGRVLHGVPKDDPVVKFFGAMESSVVYLNSAAVRLWGARRRVARLIMFGVMELGFFVSTWDRGRLELADKLMGRAVRGLFALSRRAPLGWVICADEACTFVDMARTWVRWAERRTVSLGVPEVSERLNMASNLLFELMRTLSHEVYVPGRGLSKVQLPEYSPEPPPYEVIGSVEAEYEAANGEEYDREY